MSTLSTERRITTDLASYAVADAIMVAHATLLGNVIESPERFLREEVEDKTSELERVVESETKDECQVACASVITFLGNKYPDLFDGMAILHAHGGGSRALINPRWIFHENFLVLDKNGQWYAGSPTTYHANQDGEQRFNRVISSDNLKTVLDRIIYEDEGLWPTAAFVQNAFATHPYRLPIPLSEEHSQRGKLTTMRIANYGDWKHQDPQIALLQHEVVPYLLFEFINGRVTPPAKSIR